MTDQVEATRFESPLTPEQIAKSDADLKTISSLTDNARTKGMRLELQGGYAVEALLHGRITRPHNDIDGLLWFGDYNPHTARQEVIDILNSEPTRWTIYDSKLGYLQMAGDHARKLELYMFRSPRGERPWIERTIVDSTGHEHKVTVQPVVELIASKLQILAKRGLQGEAVRRAQGLRDTSDTDKSDLASLIASPEFNKYDCIEAIARSISRDSLREISPEQALPEAIDRYEQAIKLLQ
jgi:hypothetical protein